MHKLKIGDRVRIKEIPWAVKAWELNVKIGQIGTIRAIYKNSGITHFGVTHPKWKPQGFQNLWWFRATEVKYVPKKRKTKPKKGK